HVKQDRKDTAARGEKGEGREERGENHRDVRRQRSDVRCSAADRSAMLLTLMNRRAGSPSRATSACGMRSQDGRRSNNAERRKSLASIAASTNGRQRTEYAAHSGSRPRPLSGTAAYGDRAVRSTISPN